jgi:hypothetical protein
MSRTVRSGVIVTLAAILSSFCLPSIMTLWNFVLWPTSRSNVGTTGTKSPMSLFREISSPGKVRTCPRLLREIPDRTSKRMGAEPKCVFASPLQEILPVGCDFGFICDNQESEQRMECGWF